MIRAEEETPPCTIRLIKSGNFFRAYNHSAWLFQSCVTEYRVIRKYIKALKQNIWYIGFPGERLFETLGGREAVKADYGFDVALAAEEVPAEEGYQEWLRSVEAEDSSKADDAALSPAGPGTERDVLRKLREFPLENKTMVECVAFLASLRKALNNK